MTLQCTPLGPFIWALNEESRPIPHGPERKQPILRICPQNQSNRTLRAILGVPSISIRSRDPTLENLWTPREMAAIVEKKDSWKAWTRNQALELWWFCKGHQKDDHNCVGLNQDTLKTRWP